MLIIVFKSETVFYFLSSVNRNGHKLLSAATDNTVSIWDVQNGECDRTYRFPSPILKVQFHPRNRYVISELLVFCKSFLLDQSPRDFHFIFFLVFFWFFAVRYLLLVHWNMLWSRWNLMPIQLCHLMMRWVNSEFL